MTEINIILLVTVIAGILIVTYFILGQNARSKKDEQQQTLTERISASQEQLSGRIAQIADSQITSQARIAEALQIQEREISNKLDKRLNDMNRWISEDIEKSSKSTESTIGNLKERLAIIDRAQKNITDLSSQVDELQSILSNKQARGAFGEIQLKDLITQTLPPSVYSFQASLGNNFRVDCLLNLPNPPGVIAIDAKFPLEAYYLLQASKKDDERAAARRRLAQEVSVHLRAIAEKYILPGKTAESALMFLPSEAVYTELHSNLPNVVQEAFRRRVWIVSPTTLMATLNTVRAILKDASMREQANVIQDEVHKLLDDIIRLDERVCKLDRHFMQTIDDIRQIRISTEKVTKRSERIQELELEQPNVAGDSGMNKTTLATIKD
ncbi:dihydroxy-acid dehydratase [Candidatus Endolissoclinum faulkneri L5]|uniref:DNA recombination protein RmuC homolog n=1 Tax=Candidatus Endolissoclinum faulkneri L5 TaxID=1401328 RepID=V9TVT2_9PROT|nr:DNA recombination protein RmuC [Candidatus Endolissoclinum faulkneri]AHC73445.1 dihydroxy-acid dehydratase [Candidatus Endolissoclinum faulkneri L5]